MDVMDKRIFVANNNLLFSPCANLETGVFIHMSVETSYFCDNLILYKDLCHTLMVSHWIT